MVLGKHTLLKMLLDLHIVYCLNCQKDDNKTPANFYIDLSRAFDSVKHDILLKLKTICPIYLLQLFYFIFN